MTQTDAGHRTFNFSEIMGASSAGISNIYYPREDRSMSANLSRWGVMVGEDTFSIYSRNSGLIFVSKCLSDSIRPIRRSPSQDCFPW